jgi:hypothetical protein
MLSSSMATPAGALSAKNARCFLSKSEVMARSPATASFTFPARIFRCSRPEHTKPPGMASTSTPNPLRLRRSADSSFGTTGRSFTTLSSPRVVRRARTMTPCRLSARSGVSKKKT